MSDYYGCGDSSCMFGRPKGMMTNGGCRCLENANWFDRSDMRRVRMGVQQLRAALVQAKEALGELSDLVTAVVEGEDIDWDSFTLQPARIALAAAERALLLDPPDPTGDT